MGEPLFEQYKASLRRGHMAALGGRLDEALEAYREAARLVPERALPLASQGTVLHRLDRWSEALEAFERALTLSPDDEATLRARASAREARGELPDAAADYERLAFVLDVAGRAIDAVAAARKADSLEPTPARTALAERLATSVTVAAEAAPGTAAPAAELQSEPGSASLLAPSTAAEAVTDSEAAAVVDDAATDSSATPAFPEAASPDAAPPALAEPPVLSSATSAMADELLHADDDLPPPPRIVPETDAEAARAARTEDPADTWPRLDLPSPAQEIVGPPPDPDRLLTEAASLLEAGNTDEAAERMLTAVLVHRQAGRLDAALDICLQLLSIVPGDPHVHLAIANLQLDNGWMTLAREKIELLLRLTALTGDTQAEADAHGLAAERLRDEPATAAAGR